MLFYEHTTLNDIREKEFNGYDQNALAAGI